MKTSYYRNFIEVVDCGTISAAARKLLIAQPALSSQISTLESAYGAKLLQRGPRHVTLTDAGKILYEKAKIMVSLEDAAQKDIAGCIHGTKGTLWLGTSNLEDAFSSELLLDFAAAYPDIHFEIYETSADNLQELLSSGVIEVGILRSHGHAYPDHHVDFYKEENMVAVYRRGSGFLPEDLAEIPVSMLYGVPLSISKGMRRIVTAACKEAGFDARLVSVSGTRRTALLWSQAGTAVSLVPAFSPSQYETEEFCCRPIAGDSMSVFCNFIHQKDRQLSAVARSFLEFARR